LGPENSYITRICNTKLWFSLARICFSCYPTQCPTTTTTTTLLPYTTSYNHNHSVTLHNVLQQQPLRYPTQRLTTNTTLYPYTLYYNHNHNHSVSTSHTKSLLLIPLLSVLLVTTLCATRCCLLTKYRYKNTSLYSSLLTLT
jgi:hypothetical protein